MHHCVYYLPHLTRWWGGSLVKILLKSNKPLSGPSYFCVTWKQNLLPVRCIFSNQTHIWNSKHLHESKKSFDAIFTQIWQIGRAEAKLTDNGFHKDVLLMCVYCLFTSVSETTFLQFTNKNSHFKLGEICILFIAQSVTLIEVLISVDL